MTAEAKIAQGKRAFLVAYSASLRKALFPCAIFASAVMCSSFE